MEKKKNGKEKSFFDKALINNILPTKNINIKSDSSIYKI